MLTTTAVVTAGAAGPLVAPVTLLLVLADFLAPFLILFVLTILLFNFLIYVVPGTTCWGFFWGKGEHPCVQFFLHASKLGDKTQRALL